MHVCVCTHASATGLWLSKDLSVSYPGICRHCCFSTSDWFIMCFGACNCRVDNIPTEGMEIHLFSVMLMIYLFLMMLNFLWWLFWESLNSRWISFWTLTLFACFGKQANRALRQATLGTLNSLIVAYGDKIGPSAYEVIIVELSSLIRFSVVTSPF